MQQEKGARTRRTFCEQFFRGEMVLQFAAKNLMRRVSYHEMRATITEPYFTYEWFLSYLSS